MCDFFILIINVRVVFLFKELKSWSLFWEAAVLHRAPAGGRNVARLVVRSFVCYLPQ